MAAGTTVNLAPRSTEAPPSFEQSPGGQFVQQAAQQAVTDVAGQMAWSAADRARNFLQKGAGEVSVYIEKNHYSVHVLSFCGGLALCVVSFLGLLNIFASLTGLLTYILHFYQFCFGLVICALDGPSERVPARLQYGIVQYLPFLHTNTGRSLFYLFIACLEGSQDSWFHMIAGWYFGGISFMHISLKCKNMKKGSESAPEPPLLTPAQDA
eukprot:TRINITY_DN75999_c0_g1_i1.p1 TRINITY_DN75999_c0_g1~~TRINITY_DN75999_c0_g1_i1.p1  ORF type:complete len:240 (-),score=20.08 TRINITY_DN75999_c0_g1_i1:92-724(-)